MSTTMISKNIQSALNDQINAELWSAYLYLSMSLDAEAKTLKGAANWFFVQWLEEQDHARIFQNYMNDRGASVTLKPIDGVQTKWRDLLDMFKDTLEHEKKVTAMINDLVRLAEKEQDYATLSRLQWFVDEQVEEEKNASDLIADLEYADGKYDVIRMIDRELAEREHSKPDVL